MSNDKRGAIFATGLVAGIALALFFFLWAFPWFGDPTQSARYCRSGDSHCAEQYENPADPHFWVRPFHGWLYAEDSLAQWLMAGFGVFATGVSLWAVFLVKDTLDENRKATKAALASAEGANETNRIMRLEQRPWLTLKRKLRCKFTFIEADRKTIKGGKLVFGVALYWKCRVKNVGKSPVFGMRIDQKVICATSHSDAKLMFEIFVEKFLREKANNSEETVFPDETVKMRESIIWTSVAADGNGDHEFYLFVDRRFLGPYLPSLLEYPGERITR